MSETLDSYIRNRTNALGLTLTEVCRQARISRQSFYALKLVPKRLPDLDTVVRLAEVLHVHPLRLLHLMFDRVSLHESAQKAKRGDQSAFVADVTFPDGAMVLPKQTFTKTWSLQNVGTVPWENRYLQCIDEEVVVTTRAGEVLKMAENLKPHSQRVTVPYTKPGDLVQISVNFTAPSKPATVVSYWKSVFEDGTQCFPKASGLSCVVRVTALATAAME
jgi:Ig-like domain from next to BRCA1 gene